MSYNYKHNSTHTQSQAEEHNIVKIKMVLLNSPEQLWAEAYQVNQQVMVHQVDPVCSLALL